MPEALTESFCERCGTRYEFTAPTRLNPLRKGRGLVTGLKNYIMSQDALSDTVGDAMRSETESLAASQLDAFHAAFNFCIDCRQYTCTNCWNDEAGRCRSCAPIAGTDDLLERFEASFAAQHPATNGAGIAEMEAADLAGRLGIDAWPSADPVPASADAGETEAWPAEPLPDQAAPLFDDVPVSLPDLEPEPVVAEAPVEVPLPEPEPEPEPVVAEAPVEVPLPEPEPEPEPVVAEAPVEVPLPEPVVAEAPVEVPLPEPEPEAFSKLTVLHWEPDTDFELLPEPVVFEQPEAEPEPVVFEQPEAEPEPVVFEQPEAEPEPVVFEQPEAEPVEEPIAAATSEPEFIPEVAPPAPAPTRPSIRPIGDTILRMPAPRAPEPATERPLAADDPLAAARRAQLDMLGLDDPGQGVVRPERPQVLPYRSSGAALPAGDLAQRAARNRGTSAFWDASAREVADAMSAVGVQSCGQCGLSLSASARFCRRCGTRQAQSA